jgi:acetylornithine deacetylase/succinyl-diaminopimelate desuccinylase-like protein
MSLQGSLDAGRRWSEQLLAELVACPSITGQPSEITAILQPVMAGLGLDVDVLAADPVTLTGHPEFSPPDLVQSDGPSPVLHASCRGGSSHELLLFAHTDTEPVHEGWNADPFELRISAGRASGLGAADDKAGVVCILSAIRAVNEAGLALTRRPRIVLGNGKQGGALGTLPGTIAAAGVESAVYCHPAESGRGLAHMKVASRGVVQLKVTVAGVTPPPIEERTPLSADPRHGRNAVTRAARMVSSVSSCPDDVVRTVTSFEAPGRSFEVPDEAQFVVACWFAEGTVGTIAGDLVQLLQDEAADEWEAAHPPRVEVVGMRANPASCAESPFAASVAKEIAGRTGAPVEGYAWHTASDIRFPMRCLGVPAVGFGPTAGQFYGPGEWVDLDSMHTTTAILAGMLTR